MAKPAGESAAVETAGEQSPFRLAPKTLTYAWAAAGLVLFLLGAVYIRSLPANHDVAWLLYAAGEVLGGAEIYVDIIESNPPLIMFFMVGVKWLASLFAVRDLLVFQIVVLSLVATSLILSCAILRRVLASSSGMHLAVISLVSIYMLVPWVGYHFGQREHLTVVFVMPYLFAAVARVKGIEIPRGQAIAIGIFGGIGLAMKPFFLTVWLGVEAYLALKSKFSLLRRPEQYAIVGLLLGYGLSVMLFAPAYIDLASSALKVYNGYHALGPRIIAADTGTTFTLLVLIAQSNVKASTELSQLRRVFTIATVAFLAAVFLQNKGWDYHFIHVKITGALLLTMVCIDVVRLLADDHTNKVVRWSVVGVTAAAMLTATGFHHKGVKEEWSDFGGWPWYLYSMMDLVEEHAPGGTVGSLTTVMQIGFPLVNYTGVQWSSRFNCLWLLPGLYLDVESGAGSYPYRSPEERGELEQYLFDAVITDLLASRPDLLIVDLAPPGEHMVGFDYLEYYSMDDRFREFFADYDALARVGHYVVYKKVAADS